MKALKLIKLSLLLILLGTTGLNAQITEQLPITFIRGLPIVQMSVNGQNGLFLLDTGASENFIALELKDRIGYESYKIYGKAVNSVGGDKGIHNVRYLVLKDSNDKIIDIKFQAMDLTNLRVNLKVIGILGSDFFKSGWLIDYKNKRLIKLSNNLIAEKG